MIVPRIPADLMRISASPARSLPGLPVEVVLDRGQACIVLVGGGKMTLETMLPTTQAERLYARLPSGEHVVPGLHPGCPGFDAAGLCRFAGSTQPRPCAGATWTRVGDKLWQFEFRADSDLCPAALFAPL